MSEDTGTPALNPRNQALAEIAASANARTAEDMTDLPDGWEGAVQRGAEVEAPATPAPVDPEMLTIKVDGVDVQVTKEQAIEAGVRALQKDRTADQRLTEATRLLTEARARDAKPNPRPSAEPVRPAADADAELAKLIQDAPFNDEAARKLAQRLGAPQATPKIEDLAPTIEQLVDVRLQGREAATAFQTEYQDIVSDPYLARLAASEDERLLHEGDTRPQLERWKSIGDGLRKWRGTTTQTLDAKRERKESITNLPAANARPAVQEEPKPPTPSQIVENIRKARHQPV